MKLCCDRIALTICGMTDSSYPTMPGKSGSPDRNFAIRLSRSSCLTSRRGMLPASTARRRSPRTVGWGIDSILHELADQLPARVAAETERVPDKRFTLQRRV